MNIYTIGLLVWVLSGSLAASITLRIKYKDGEDIVLSDLVFFSSCTLLGTLSLFIMLYAIYEEEIVPACRKLGQVKIFKHKK